MARTATAAWRGTLKEGDGNLALGSGAFEGSFGFQSRFEDGPGTNPEELIGAALAGCYSMQLGAQLEREGSPADSVETEAKVHLRRGDAGPYIERIDLTTRASVPGIEPAKFDETAQSAKENCLIHKALAGVETITLDATLES
jgi:lipoyl-dependent peroxiredoxin